MKKIYAKKIKFIILKILFVITATAQAAILEHGRSEQSRLETLKQEIIDNTKKVMLDSEAIIQEIFGSDFCQKTSPQIYQHIRFIFNSLYGKFSNANFDGKNKLITHYSPKNLQLNDIQFFWTFPQKQIGNELEK